MVAGHIFPEDIHFQTNGTTFDHTYSFVIIFLRLPGHLQYWCPLCFYIRAFALIKEIICAQILFTRRKFFFSATMNIIQTFSGLTSPINLLSLV